MLWKKPGNLCCCSLRKKELGNFSISVDDHQTALSTYNFAKEMMEQATDVVEPSLKVAIWNNMAACHLKVRVWERGREVCVWGERYACV